MVWIAGSGMRWLGCHSARARRARRTVAAPAAPAVKKARRPDNKGLYPRKVPARYYAANDAPRGGFPLWTLGLRRVLQLTFAPRKHRHGRSLRALSDRLRAGGRQRQPVRLAGAML